jgi:hypothetical protein
MILMIHFWIQIVYQKYIRYELQIIYTSQKS